MNGNPDRDGVSRARPRLSLALAILGAVLALVGGVILYARENLFDSAALSDRAQDALSDERVRLAVAQPITDAIIDSGPPEFVNARPLIESVITGALGTPPVRAIVGEAVVAVNQKLFERDPKALLLNLANAASVAAGALEAVSPTLAGDVPARIKGARIEITGSEGSLGTLSVAHDVRVAGLVLPPLAILVLIGSVAVALDRRRALVRAGLAVAGAAVVGLLLLAIGRELLLAQFADPLVSDAVDATWDALLGDLRSAMLFAGILAVVLAAAARFTADEEFDPLAPFARAGALLRSRPERTWAAVLRSLSLIAIGLAFVLEPEFTLELVAVVAGAWVLYVGIGELLAIVAPPVEGDGRAMERRLRPGRLAVLGSVLAAVVVVVVAVSGGDGTRVRPPGPPAACNGYVELCDMRIDEVAFPATHNSMSAAAEAGWFLPNQRYGIGRQLDDGIRGLLIDTHYGIRRGSGRGFAEVITDLQEEQKTREEVVAELGEETVQQAEELVGALAFGGARGKPEPFLCHVLCELGATDLDDALDGIFEWMQGHPDEFLVIFIEDVVSPEETAAAFERSGLLRYAYVPDRDAPSPTLGELIESDERLLVMAENDAGGGKYPWYVQGFDYVQETPYTFNSLAEIEPPESCKLNRGKPDNPLFQLNNWIEKIPRSPALAAKINSLEALGARARRCGRIRGLTPNLLNVDYYDQGDVFGVANELNGLPADAKPEVRTQP